MKNNIYVFGEVLFDVFSDSQKMGGAPFNLACHLTGFGLDVSMVSTVGDDPNGESILGFMQSRGMTAEYMKKSDKFPTGKVDISFENGTHSFHIHKNQAYDYIDTYEAGKDTEHSDFILCHGSLALRESFNRQELERLRGMKGCRVFCDLNLRGEWRDRELIEFTLKGAEWLKMNDEELNYLKEMYSLDSSHEKAAMQIMEKFGISAVYLTMGADGACIYTADTKDCRTVEIKKEITDTVGAGDAFGSVCLLGIVKGWDMEKVLESSIRFASDICGIRGAIPDDETFYERYKKQWQL